MAAFTTSAKLNIGYKGKMFKQPKCEFTVAHAVPEGEDETETKLLRAAYAKLWEKNFTKLEKKRSAEFKKAMDGTEKDIEKKDYSEDQLKKFIETANQLIKQGLKTFQNEVQSLATTCMEQVYDYVEKKLKKKMTRKKIKTGLKITALVLITLAVAAASIAATVLTGGVAAVVIAAAIGTGVGALITSGKTIKKEYDSYKGFLDKIEKDINAITKAVEYQEKKKKASEFRKLGPKEKVKLLMAGTSGHVKSLKKHLEDGATRMLLMRKHMNEALVKANEARENADKMKGHPDKAISAEAAEAERLAKEMAYKLEKFETKKKKYDELKAEAAKVIKDLETKGIWDGGKLSKAIKFAEDHEDTANFMISAGKALAKSGAKIVKAVK